MQELVAFAIVAGIFTVTPGLDTFFVLRSAMRFGFRSGVLATLGICTGTTVWALASGAGVAAIIVASQEAFTLMRLAGAVYLVYLGIRAVWSGVRGTVTPHREVAVASMEGWRAFRIGLANNLLNPKVGVFYLTIFPQFIPEDGNPLVWSSALSLIHWTEGVLWLTVVALFAASFRPLFARPLVTRALDVVSGLIFIAFGARVARDLRA